MWSVQSEKIKQHKKRVNYTINKHTIDRFKVVADKDINLVAQALNTSPEIVKSNYLNYSDEWARNRFKVSDK